MVAGGRVLEWKAEGLAPPLISFILLVICKGLMTQCLVFELRSHDHWTTIAGISLIHIPIIISCAHVSVEDQV